MRPVTIVIPVLTTLALLSTALRSAVAHESWIAPERYVLTSGAPVIANLRVGEKFSGSAYAFLPENFVRLEVSLNKSLMPVIGRLGDVPAINTPVSDEGLGIIIHETPWSKLTYYKPEKFEKFIKNKDLLHVLNDVDLKNFPTSGVTEGFRRFSKSLIAIGDGKGEDRAFSLLTEIIAEANPYTENMTNGLPLRVLFRGHPRRDVQVEVFAKDPDGAVKLVHLRTDMSGRVRIPVTAGIEYLISAVVMQSWPKGKPASEKMNGKMPAWESLWASLTFKIPAGLESPSHSQ